MDCEKWRIGSGQVYAYAQSYKDELKVHIRKFQIVESGKCFPTKKGVTLSFKEWEAFKSLVQTIDLEFRKQLSQRIETTETQSPWCNDFGKFPEISSNEIICTSFENYGR